MALVPHVSSEPGSAQGGAGGRQGRGRRGLRAASWTEAGLGWQLAFGSPGEQSWVGLLPPTPHAVQTHQPKVRVSGFKSYLVTLSKWL